MASLRARLAQARPDSGARLEAPGASLALDDLANLTGLGPAREALSGRNILVRAARQIGAAQALVELDGLARRIVLCPPDLASEHLPYVIGAAEIDAIVTDASDEVLANLGVPVHTLDAPSAPLSAAERGGAHETEWVLFTSGTTGPPKLVAHSLAGLTGAIPPPQTTAGRPVWGTFYDIRRYGGLQILLRALAGGCALVLSDEAEALADHLARLARAGATHVSGTPSQWRRLLMLPGLAPIAPDYVRLSGEIADQAVLDGLKAKFTLARIAHAYASTEAGVAFEVGDGREGFPEDLVGRPGPVEMKVADGSLRIRSSRTASGYIGPGAPPLADAEGFIDTGDLVELADGRWRFVGRRNGVINVGGLKVHPEEVEAVINRHPAVRMSVVRARANPITGAVVTAEVALVDPLAADTQEQKATLRASIIALCRAALPPHKAPATIKFVPELDVTAGGKLDRRHG
jgi:acyl-coenzyme A synthetase/AMP-(fatty) acid ligase